MHMHVCVCVCVIILEIKVIYTYVLRYKCIHLYCYDVNFILMVHHSSYFRTEESKDSVLTIPVGNVTADTELSYEYGVRNKKKEQTSPPTQGSTEEDEGAVGGGGN